MKIYLIISIVLIIVAIISMVYTLLNKDDNETKMIFTLVCSISCFIGFFACLIMYSISYSYNDYEDVINEEKIVTAYIKEYGFNENDPFIINSVQKLQESISNFNNMPSFLKEKEIRNIKIDNYVYKEK
jgi:amino acid permease